jgi:hypothetical protein
MRLLIATSMILMSAGAHAENDKSLTGHGLTTITGTATTIKSRSYVFEPKDDITAPELAKAMKIVLPFIANRNPFTPAPIELIDNAPAEVKRHFREEPAR